MEYHKYNIYCMRLFWIHNPRVVQWKYWFSNVYSFHLFYESWRVEKSHWSVFFPLAYTVNFCECCLVWRILVWRFIILVLVCVRVILFLFVLKSGLAFVNTFREWCDRGINSVFWAAGYYVCICCSILHTRALCHHVSHSIGLSVCVCVCVHVRLTAPQP